MQLIEQMGILPDRHVRQRRPKLRSVFYAIVAAVRINKMCCEWQTARELRNDLRRGVEIAAAAKRRVKSKAV